MKKILIIAAVAILLSGCAESQPQIKPALIGQEYGFFGGLWHRFIAPVSFFGKIIDNDIDMYAINNSGNWYALGFVLGAGILLGGAKTSKNLKICSSQQ